MKPTEASGALNRGWCRGVKASMEGLTVKAARVFSSGLPCGLQFSAKGAARILWGGLDASRRGSRGPSSSR